eukprot:m.129224 g.129224  ORF g.129224 m.129224 type:complete len:119 (+) comp13042_c5_seq3:56-412(+)
MAPKKKKKGGKKKKASAKTSKASGPQEPILPTVCLSCGALYCPVKGATFCTICTHAQDNVMVFGSLSDPNIDPNKLAEEATNASEGAAPKKKKKAGTKKKGGVKKKKTGSIKKKKKKK